MKLKKECKDLLTDPEYWKTVSEPTLLSFLAYRKKTIIASLSQDQEYLRYQRNLEKIISNYNQGTNWHKTATLALKNLKTRDTIQAYEIGKNYLSRTSSVVENINVNDLSDENTFLVNQNVASSSKTTTITSTSTLTASDNNDDESEISTSSILGKRVREDKSVEMDEIIVDYTKHQLLKEYCTLLSKLQHHPVEEESQRARHLISMLRWHVVDQEMFNSIGWTKIPQRHFVSKPSFGLRLVSNVLKQHSNNQLHLAERSLQNLIMNNKIKDSDHSSFITSIMQFFSRKLDDKYFDIDALTVVSVVSSMILYTPTSCRGLGSSPFENHIKAELWTKIFSNVFTLNKTKFVPVWELHHLISGNGSRGSARSDFGAIVTNRNDLQFPFFIVEFERGGFEIHKDNLVVVSEAVYEFNRILALAHDLSEEEVNRTRIHIGLVNDTRISFSTITPKNIENALQLVTYLRETICEDGLWIETILNREPTRYNYKLKTLLPKLPNEALKSRTSETKFTPLSKRKRYVFSDTLQYT
ncbi:2041_t:CDS:2 [Cetraspora pellucida]|uniref:2041_t:CDS:1 n=1 Tax=Cetraspora pellucida TaxID=1433469 RepID=A0A9N9EJL1_9GLOM|nr:2041_t:CDS:2 [Cetraspora pellucida]